MRIVLALWVLFAWLPAPQPAAASRPVHAVITGCVQGGVFVSEYAAGDTGESGWMPGDASGEGVKFPDPLVDGVPLDYCLQWGRDCGRPAADAWCRAQGFAAASAFEVRLQSPPTRVLATGQVCDEVHCDRMASVTCIGGNRP
jgi:hypothetical protein